MNQESAFKMNFTIQNMLGLLDDYYVLVGTGIAGYVLTSNGPGLSPTWQAGGGSFVPYTGATGNVNLGVYDLYADEIFGDEVGAGSRFSFGTNTDISLDGDEGNIGDIMLSQGNSAVPIWQSQSTFFSNAILSLSTYNSNAAALAGGLVQGQLYASSTGVVSIVL